MSETILLDTDVVIHLLHQQEKIRNCFETQYEQGVIFLLSPIVVAEIYAGAFQKEHQTIESFFSLCEPITLNHDIARQAGYYAKQYRKAYNKISLEDYFLAATAKIKRCPLWTHNYKHFPMQDIIIFSENTIQTNNSNPK